MPLFGYNPDNGLLLGVQYIHRGFGFKKRNVQTVGLRYAFETSAYDFEYNGDFLNLFQKFDFSFQVDWEGPLYVVNYFGMGNETLMPEVDRNFFRVRRARFFVSPAVQKRFKDGRTRLRLGPVFERRRIEETPDRILTSDFIEVPTDIFDPDNFIGAGVSFTHENLDKPSFPCNGIVFNSWINYRASTRDISNDFIRLEAGMKLYHTFDKFDRLMLATQFGVRHISGHFDFHQAPTLGGGDNLRGFAQERFTGNTVFYHNTDLRIRLLRIKRGFIPSSVGVTAGFDYGRVWMPEENSELWHIGYGGQLWIAPLDYFVLSTGMFFSEEDSRFTIRLGFSF